jgi:cytochrome c oxidase accessory protein FixG
LVAHVFLSYFVSLPGLFVMVRDRPAEHPEAFAWASAITGLMYFNFAWFREQLCIVICPYGRLQSVLTDQDSLVIGYDKTRGEPRGKAKDPQRGACVDCGRCVAVCPTGIDIRNGLQLECIGCTACVDACDEIMVRTKQPTGLIRYDSLTGLAGLTRRFLRPRVYVYAVLGAVGLLVATLSVRARTPFEANLLRLQGAPFVVENDGTQVRNALELHLVNKHAGPVTFTLLGEQASQLRYVFAQPRVKLESLRALRVPVFVTAPNDGARRLLKIRVSDGSSSRVVEAPFVAPR